MKYTYYAPVTGSRAVLCEQRYSEYADFGQGLLMACYGPLDRPDLLPAGASTALPIRGSAARARIDAQAANGDYPSPACTFWHCTCGGDGQTVHVRDVHL